MSIYMLLFRLGGGLACFLVATASAALLTLLIFSKPKLWSNRLKYYDESSTTELIHIKRDLTNKGAYVATSLVLVFMLALPFLVASTLHNGHVLHAEIIRIIMRALS